jgi:hypothetical protein
MSWPFMSLAEPETPAEAPVDNAVTATAKRYLENVDAAWKAAQTAGAPAYLVFALLEKESMGKNIYGHDAGGVFSGPGQKTVTQTNFEEFYRRVVVNRERSNGVGPLQITYRGFFPEMKAQGLRAWVPYDNILFGTRLFMGYFNTYRNRGNSVDESIRLAGIKYNGATAYGSRLLEIARKWRARVG